MKSQLQFIGVFCLLNAIGVFGQERPKSFYSFGYGKSTDASLSIDLNHDHNLFFQYEKQISSGSFHWVVRGDFGVYESIQVGGNEFPVHFSFQKDRKFALGDQVKHDNLSAGVKQFATFDAINLFFRVSPSISFNRHWSKRLQAGIALGQSFWYYKLEGLANSDVITVDDPRYGPTEMALLTSPAYKRGLDFSQSIRPELSCRLFGNVSAAANAVMEFNAFHGEVYGLWVFLGFKFQI